MGGGGRESLRESEGEWVVAGRLITCGNGWQPLGINCGVATYGLLLATYGMAGWGWLKKGGGGKQKKLFD